MSLVNFKEISAYRNAWDLTSVCSPDRRQMWENLNDIGSTTLGECCYVTVTNSSDYCVFYSCDGGDDRFSTFLFGVRRMFPHASGDHPSQLCLLPGYSSGVIQKKLSKSELEIFDGFISLSLSARSGRRYTVSCCWNEWHETGGLCGTKAGIVIRCAEEGADGGYPEGEVPAVVDECHDMYFADGTALQPLEEKARDFRVVCTFRRSAFHFEICNLAPTSADQCKGYRVSDLSQPLSLGDVVVRQLENLCVHLPDVTFCCVCIDNNFPVALQGPSPHSVSGYFFTPVSAIAALPPAHRVGILHAQVAGGPPVCSGCLQYRLHYLRDDYVICLGWYIDVKTEDYTAGLEIRILPKLLDNRENVNRNGVNEKGEIVDKEAFVRSIRPPPKCHSFLTSPPAASKTKRKISPWRDSLPEPTVAVMGRVACAVMFTREQFRFSVSDPGGGLDKSPSAKKF